jgi:ribosomal-protein-alanine N-acetyltransferase
VIELRPIGDGDAAALFPLIFESPVTDTLLWDGPRSIEELEAGLRARADGTRAGLMHVYTLWTGGAPIGSIGLEPGRQPHEATIGLWIGAPFQARGHGTEAIAQITGIGFRTLGLERIEARIFTGNGASRRAFEKNGYRLEGTARHGAIKRGRCVDEWVFALLRDEYFGRLQ